MGVNKKGGLVGGFDQLRAPDAPTISVSAGNEKVTVTFTNPSDTGGGDISSYTATAIAGGVSTGVTSASSPIEITGLTNDTSYSVTGLANNVFGAGPYSAATSSSPVAPRAFWLGRTTVNVFYSNITSLGNTTDWGYAMQYAAYYPPTASSATRGVQCGYDADPNAASSRKIEKLNLASAGAGTNFGELSVTSAQAGAGGGNGTRGIFTQGWNSSYAATDTIEYVTIASEGNASDFGNLLTARVIVSGCASPTRAVFSGGQTSINVIDYVTIMSTGNSTDFGDLVVGRNGTASCSSSTRGIISGGDAGSGQTNHIDYITIASAGNATDFGDLTNPVRYHGAGCSSTRALIAGEYVGNATGIDYLTIASTGNGTDFGDLTNAETNGLSCFSAAHGGLS
mgnify:CR=1 FL=1